MSSAASLRGASACLGACLGAVVALASAHAAPIARDPPLPFEGAFDRGRAAVPTLSGAGLSAAACGDCHRAEHEEWQQSAHARAYEEPVFQLELAHSNQTWCLNCHTPLDVQVQEALQGRPRLAREGVNCAGCHLRGEVVLARTVSGDAPHPSRAEPAFGAPVWCGGCHEFGFPRFDRAGVLLGFTEDPMQSTLSELQRHARVSATRACQSCHGSPAGHLFPAVLAGDKLADLVDVRACRAASGVIVALRPGEAGHLVPTGGVNRHLVLRAWHSEAPERLQEVTFGRTFGPAEGGAKRTLSDTRLVPGEVRRVALAAGPGVLNLAWVYRFVSPRLEEEALARGVPQERVLFERRVRAAELPSCAEEDLAASRLR